MAEADSLFQQLYRCLAEQEEIIDRLITAGEDQLQALRENNVGRLCEITGEQEAWAAQAMKAEERRLLIQGSLESELNLQKGAAMRELLPHAPAGMKASLEEVYKSLRRKVNDLKEINSLCSAVVKKALLVNNRLVQILRAGVPVSYGQKGEVKDQLQQRTFLNESV